MLPGLWMLEAHKQNIFLAAFLNYLLLGPMNLVAGLQLHMPDQTFAAWSRPVCILNDGRTIIIFIMRRMWTSNMDWEYRQRYHSCAINEMEYSTSYQLLWCFLYAISIVRWHISTYNPRKDAIVIEILSISKHQSGSAQRQPAESYAPIPELGHDQIYPWVNIQGTWLDDSGVMQKDEIKWYARQPPWWYIAIYCIPCFHTHRECSHHWKLLIAPMSHDQMEGVNSNRHHPACKGAGCRSRCMRRNSGR